MVTKEQKKKIVAELVELISNGSSYYFVDFKGMPITATDALRNELKKKNTKFRVAKNTLIKLAFDQAEGLEFPFEKLEGPTALVIGNEEDPLAAAKVLRDVIEKTKAPQFKGALVEGQFFNADQLKTLADMPSKPEIISSIIGSLEAPISGIVGSINAVIRDLACIVEEVAKKQANA